MISIEIVHKYTLFPYDILFYSYIYCTYSSFLLATCYSCINYLFIINVCFLSELFSYLCLMWVFFSLYAFSMLLVSYFFVFLSIRQCSVSFVFLFVDQFLMFSFSLVIFLNNNGDEWYVWILENVSLVPTIDSILGKMYIGISLNIVREECWENRFKTCLH